MFEALWNESLLWYFCTPTLSYQSVYCGVLFDLPGAGNIQLECFMWKKCVPGGVGVLTEGYTHQILFIISLPLVMCPRTLQSLVSTYIFMWKRVLIQSTQNQSVDSISASRSKRSNRYLRTLERRSENETTFVKWKPQGRGKNHSCSALWWWHLLWS